MDPEIGASSDERSSSVRVALANSMMGIMKELYGKGPTGAKAWVLDDYVFVAMEGGLARNEETLLADGKESVVRAYRLAFQETVRDTMMSTVAEITGRRVLEYHSQIVFDPTRAFEIFVLEPRAPKAATVDRLDQGHPADRAAVDAGQRDRASALGELDRRDPADGRNAR